MEITVHYSTRNLKRELRDRMRVISLATGRSMENILNLGLKVGLEELERRMDERRRRRARRETQEGEEDEG